MSLNEAPLLVKLVVGAAAKLVRKTVMMRGTPWALSLISPLGFKGICLRHCVHCWCLTWFSATPADVADQH